MSMETWKTKIIKKAWEDPDFKAKLLADPKSAIEEAFGIKVPQGIELTAVEETSSRFVLVIPPNPEDTNGLVAGTASVEYVWN